MRTLGRWMLRGTLALALLFAALLLWLRSAAGNDWMRAQILSAIEPQMARGSVTLEGVNTDLVRTFELVGLEFQDETAQIVRVERVAVTVSPLTLLSDSIAVRSVVIDGFSANLVTDESGTVNLSALFDVGEVPAEPMGVYQGIGVDLTIDAVEFSATSIAMDGMRIESLRVNASVELAGSAVTLRDLTASAAVGEPMNATVSLHGNAGLRDGDLFLEAVELSDGVSRLGLSGTVEQVETEPMVDVSLRLDAIEPASIERIAGEAVLSEAVSGAIAVTGTTAAVAAEGRLRGASEDGGVSLGVTVDLDQEPISWSVRLEPSDLGVDTLTPLVPADTRLDGVVRIDGAGTEFPERMRATVEAEFDVQRVAGHRIRAAGIRADLAEGTLTVHEARITDGNATLTASGSADLVASTATSQFNARAFNARGLYQYGAPRMAGELEIDGELTAAWASELNADLAAQLRGQRFEMDGHSIDALRGSATAVLRGEAFRGVADASVKGVRADGVTLERADMSATVSGDASGPRSARVTVDIGAADVPDAELTLGGVSGEARIQFDPSGRPSGTGDFEVSEAQYGSRYSVDGGPVTVAIDGDRVEVSLDLRRNDAPFLVGSVSGDLATGQWSLDGFELAILESKGFAAEGPMQFTLTEDGARDVDMRIVSPDGLGEIAVNGVVEPDTPNFALTASRIQLGAVRGLLQEMLGEDVVGDAMSDVDGVLSMDVAVTSTPGGRPVASGWLEARDLAAHGWVDGVQLRLDATMGSDQAVVEASLEGHEQLLMWSKASVGLAEVAGTIRPRCDAPIRWRSIVPGARLRDLRRSLTVIDPSVDGRVSLDAAVDGLVCEPTAEIYGALDAPVGVNGERVRLDLAGSAAAGTVAIGVTASQEGRSLAQFTVALETMVHAMLTALIEGSGVDDPATPELWIDTVDATLDFMDADVSRLARMAGVNHPLGGLLNGGLTVRGPLGRPLVSGTVELNKGHFGEAQVDVLRASVIPGEGGLTVDAQARFDAGGELVVAGRVAADGMDARAIADGTFSPAVEARFSGAGVPIAVAAGPSGLTDANGLLSVSGQIGGTVDAPTADIRVQSSEAAFTVVPTGLRYEPVEMDLRFTGRTLRLDRLHVSATPTWGLNPKPGTVDVAGTVALGDATELDIRTAMDGFWISSTRSAELATSGTISVRGDYPNLDLGGDVSIDSANVVVGPDAFKDTSGFEVDPIVTIHRDRRTVIEREQLAAPSDFEQMRVDVNIDLGQAVRLRADVPMSEEFGQKFAQLATMSVDLGLDGALHVTQDNRVLSVVGELETLRGEATAFGKRFGIQQGTVTFTGEDVANPQLRLDASHRVGQYGTVDIAIGGDVDNTRMDLSSPEYPDETDVMSMLLFGKPTAAMSETEGESGAGLLSAAMASAGGKAARATGAAFLQNVQIDPGSGAVKVGFPLTDKVYLSIQRVSPDTDTDNMTQAAVEWILSRSTYGEVVTGDRGQSSGDLYWRWRF